MVKVFDRTRTLQHSAYVASTARIVSSFLGNNILPIEELVPLIQATFRTLSQLGEPELSKTRSLVPAVPVTESVWPGHLVSLETGKHFKTLKAHLRKLGMTPGQYRAKWNLPADYPMVAAMHSANRSSMAKSWRLGRTD